MLRQRVFVGALILSVVAWGTPARSADPPEIALTIENHRFTPEAITVTAGTSFVLVIGPGLGQHRRALALARKRSPEQP